jgi:membrane-bound serine protease (ClpP class)
MLLIDSPVPEMRIHAGVAIAVGLPFALIALLLTALVVRARRSRVVTGSEGMLGQIGVAAGPLSPGGKVFVHGEYWNAVSVTPVSDGVPVKVTGLEQLTLSVQPVSKQPGG